ncbi:plasmid mobilization protein [Actinoplanes regularis]|uniref:plasmid mobilization protein n=1 Tax=Actinoplanes regularis TaxID=52697 RepID=UPI0024A176D5|nr:hypothetical protein [Actinoplanes regularis]GLW36020.1 hypothetical protein Areg01_89550 [Actinoplanes regularis]
MDNETLPTGQDDTRGRDRRHLYPGRPRRLTPRFTPEELEDVKAAARAVGMTPTGYLAEAGLAHARHTRPAHLEPVREELRLLQLDLFQARTTTGRIGAHLDQILAGFVAVGTVPAELAEVVGSCAQRLAALDELIDRVDQQLR